MATSFDPGTMATQLATYYVQGTQQLLDAQAAKAKSTSSALSKLQSALRAFDTAVKGVSSRQGLMQYSAGFSTPAIGTASASATAQAGTYSFFVERLATTHQVGYREPPAIPVGLAGPLVVHLDDGSSFNVNLPTADLNGDGTISHAEIARAINSAEGNQGLVTASVVTDGNGDSTLVLSSGKSGAGGHITLDTSGFPDTDPVTGDANAAKAALAAGGTTLAGAQDAVVWLGDQGNGIRMEQGSNTFEAIAGVSLSFTQAMKPGDSPVTLTVARNDQATGDKVQSFVDAYNTLAKTLDELTRTGSATEGTSAAAFATDAGVRALRSRLNNILRQDFGGLTLNALGVSADRNGQLTLDRSRLERTLGDTPEALDQVLGNASPTSSSGVLGAVSTTLEQWLNTTSGHIQRRQEIVQKTQANLSTRQARLDVQYDNAFTRYLLQFTQLQTLMAQMEENTGMFAQLSSMSFSTSS